MTFEEWLENVWEENSGYGDPGDCRKWMEEAWEAGFAAAVEAARDMGIAEGK